VTDRDHFAAAALTGLMTGLTMFDLDVVAKQAFDIADAMLRERGAAVRDNCVSGNNHEIGCPPALTDEERESVAFFADIHAEDQPPHEYAATLRSLLERMK